MPQHRLRPGYVPAALVLALATAAACGLEDAATTSKTASAPATRSPGAATAAAPNGVEKLDPTAILARARKATASARSLRIRGTIEDGKDKIALDFRYSGRTKATGWFRQGNERVEMTRIGKEIYLRGNNAFWKAIGGKGAVQLFSGKHLKTTTTAADFKDMAAFTDRTAIFNEAVKASAAPGTRLRPGRSPQPRAAAERRARRRDPGATHGAPYVLRLDATGQPHRVPRLREAGGRPAPPLYTVVDGDAFN